MKSFSVSMILLFAVTLCYIVVDSLIDLNVSSNDCSLLLQKVYISHMAHWMPVHLASKSRVTETPMQF